MKQEIIDRIIELHEAGMSYSQISDAIHVPVNTIKGIFFKRRQPPAIMKPDKLCLNCGKKILIGRVNRHFCSDQCRQTYYNHHRHPRSKFTDEKQCPICRKSFRYYPSSGQKYCSRECSLTGRYGTILA